MQRIAQRNGRDVLPVDFAACNAYAGGIEAAAALQCPALFVLGSGDMMTPARSAQPLIDACKDKRVITLQGTGHSMMSEDPEGVREALRDFASHVFT
jgi:pimeloyl-ACP methyl ester carboxylesterase